jgi:quinol monooxygenase YgiN
VRYEMYRDGLQEKYIADMIEQWHEIQDIETMLQGTRFVEWAMEKCFISLS